MAAIDTTTYLADLKEMFAKSMDLLTYDDNPFLMKVQKDRTGGGGSDMKVPVVYGANVGVAATLALAQAQSTIATSGAFSVPPMTYYGLVDVPNTAIRQTNGNKKAFQNLMTLNFKTLMSQLSHRLGQLYYGSGWGDVGTVAAVTATDFTFTNRSSIVGIEVGDTLVFSAAQSGAATRAGAGGVSTVTAVNRDTGLVTCTLLAGIGVLVGDFVFHQGDREAAGTNMQVPAGLAAYLPPSSAAPGTLFGFNRNPDRTRLAGTYVVASGGNLPTIYKLCSRIKENGGKVDTCWMSTMTLAATILELNGNVRYEKISSQDSKLATFSFESVRVATPSGPVDLVGDPNCPDAITFATETSSFEIWCNEDLITAANPNGEYYQQRDTSDTTECRLTHQGNLLCYAPGHNGVASGLNVAA